MTSGIVSEHHEEREECIRLCRLLLHAGCYLQIPSNVRSVLLAPVLPITMSAFIWRLDGLEQERQNAGFVYAFGHRFFKSSPTEMCLNEVC